MSDQLNDLLSRVQAAAYLHLRPQTLAHWHSTKRYRLPLVKVGSKVLYRRADLDAFLAARTVGGEVAAEAANLIPETPETRPPIGRRWPGLTEKVHGIEV